MDLSPFEAIQGQSFCIVRSKSGQKAVKSDHFGLKTSNGNEDGLSEGGLFIFIGLYSC